MRLEIRAVREIPRNTIQGKKIGWRDGFRAIYCILKYGWFTTRKKANKKYVKE